MSGKTGVDKVREARARVTEAERARRRGPAQEPAPHTAPAVDSERKAQVWGARAEPSRKGEARHHEARKMSPAQEAAFKQAHEQPDVESRTTDKTKRAQHVAGDVTRSTGYAAGVTQWWRLGAKLGYVYIRDRLHALSLRRVAIRSIGAVHIGIHRYGIAVAAGQTDYFMASNGKLWRHPHAKLPTFAPVLADMDYNARKAFAEEALAQFQATHLPRAEVQLVREVVLRYQAIVQGLVSTKIMQAAADGFVRTAADFARGCMSDWDEHDLLHCSAPDLAHAVLVSLALGLTPSEASDLIELGAYIGMRAPLVDAHEARGIFLRAQQQLSRLCPPWYSATYLTDWSAHGSIAEHFERGWNAALRHAWSTRTPLHNPPPKSNT